MRRALLELEEECSSIIVFLRVPSLTCLCATTHPSVRSFVPSSSTYTVLLAWGSREQGAGREGGCRTEESHRRQQRSPSFALSMAKLLQCLPCLRLRAAEAAWHCRLQPLPDLRQLLLHRHTIHYPPLPLLRQQILPLSQTKEGCVSTSRRTAAAQARENHKREPRVSPQHSIGSVAVR